MNKPLVDLNIPFSFQISKNEFYHFDPTLENNADQHLYYLSEDILQITHKPTSLVIDLGWYGDFSTNQGLFKIYIIKNFDWDNPIGEFENKDLLQTILQLKKIIKEVEVGKYN